jgi:putative nucleotidyltransferase with HDIG domain
MNDIPSMELCRKLMKENMLPNIYGHSVQVMNVAKMITSNLKNSCGLNIELIIAASLLHDISKTKSLTTKEFHDAEGGRFLRALGYGSVAEIVEEHVFLKNFDPEDRLNEKEIVYYADKRVMHEKIVSIKERMEDIILRYGNTPEKIALIRNNTALIQEVEMKINRHSSSDITQLFE